MSDEAALLAAIFAHPDEDTPRLIYADWLEEHDQPERAEFIRLQVESEKRAKDNRREDRLEQTHRGAWTAHLPLDPRQTHEPWTWHFYRGIPESLWCDAAGYVAHHHELTTGTFIRDLYLSEATTYLLPDVVRVGWPPSVVTLTLQECPRMPRFVHEYDCTSGIAAVAAAPQLRQLRTLRLCIYSLGETAVRALASSPHFNDNVSIGIDYCWMTPNCVELLRERFHSRLVYTAPPARG